jgi:hypothetical protein
LWRVFRVIGEHCPFMCRVTPLKQGIITLHKTLAIFFSFSPWDPVDTHKVSWEETNKEAGCFGKQHACSSRHFVFHNLHGVSSHSLLELWSYMQAPLGGGLKVIWIIRSPCLLWRGRHCCQCLPPWTWVSSLSSGDSSAFPYTKWPAVCTA